MNEPLVQVSTDVDAEASPPTRSTPETETCEVCGCPVDPDLTVCCPRCGMAVICFACVDDHGQVHISIRAAEEKRRARPGSRSTEPRNRTRRR